MEQDPSTAMTPEEAMEALSVAYPYLKDITSGGFFQSTELPDVTRRAVNAALAPISGLVWTTEQLRAWLAYKMEQKLRFVPPERITTPDPSVAGPAIEALRYAAHREELREMYANLLARAMDEEMAARADGVCAQTLRQGHRGTRLSRASCHSPLR